MQSAASKKLDENSQTIALYAGILSIVEIGLGCVLYSLKVPLTGTLLSLNQIFILSFASSSSISPKRTQASSISCVVAVIKSLGPIGKKLTPMLAITMQGLLFSIGTLCFGNSHLGRVFGASLASLWSFIQPILLYYFFFGDALFQSLELASTTMCSLLHIPGISLHQLFGLCIFCKMLIAVCIALYSSFLSKHRFDRYVQAMTANVHTHSFMQKGSHSKHSVREMFLLAIKDLVSPFFLVSIVLTAVFFVFQQTSPVWIVWSVLRPMALCLCYFFFIRIVPVEKIDILYKKLQCENFSEVVKSTLKTIQSLAQR